MNKKILIITSLSFLTFCMGFTISKKYDETASSNVADLKISHTCLSCQNLNAQAVFKNGDTVAYRQIVDSIINDVCISNPNYFSYSLAMANRYGYVPAYYDVYLSLKDCFRRNETTMDEQTKAMALFYLRQGVKKKDIRAIKEWIKVEGAEIAWDSDEHILNSL